MALKGEWVDKINGVDINSADDINQVAHAVIELEERETSGITQESDPTVPSWAKQPSKPQYSADEVGADESGTAANVVSIHNVNTDAHQDIRALLSELKSAVNAFLDIDNETYDQLSELIQKIEENADSIENITNGKVNVADIVNNLTSNVTNKPLSAAQGVALKALIDAIPAWAKQANKPTYKASEVGAVSQTELEGAVNTALAQAKESGEFDGADGSSGKDGTSVTVSNVTTSSADGGSNVVTFSDGKTVTIKNGSKGSTGPAYTLTASDKTSIANSVKSSLPTLTMVGKDEDGVSHTWTIYGS